LVELLHSDTSYPAGSRVLEAGCGVGAQTVTLARNSPGALITSVDISAYDLDLELANACWFFPTACLAVVLTVLMMTLEWVEVLTSTVLRISL
jgi:tRNA A58 N-methylase Trm61